MPRGRKPFKTGSYITIHSCPLCGFKTKSMTGIRLHEQKQHPNFTFVTKDPQPGKSICVVCKKTFESVQDYWQHSKMKNH